MGSAPRFSGGRCASHDRLDTNGRMHQHQNLCRCPGMYLTLMQCTCFNSARWCCSMRLTPNAQVFYQIGLSGFSYILSIIIADTSSLQNRALAFAFSSSPSLITTFIGPPIARWFYEQSSWRWAFGFSSISFLLLSLPILVVLMRNARKAAKLGVLPTSPDVKIAPKSLAY